MPRANGTGTPAGSLSRCMMPSPKAGERTRHVLRGLGGTVPGSADGVCQGPGVRAGLARSRSHWKGLGLQSRQRGRQRGVRGCQGPSGGASRAVRAVGSGPQCGGGHRRVFSGRAMWSGLPLGKGEKVTLAAEMGDGPSRTAARGARSVLGTFVAILPTARSRNEGSRHVGCLFDPLIPSSTTRMSRGNLTP